MPYLAYSKGSLTLCRDWMGVPVHERWDDRREKKLALLCKLRKDFKKKHKYKYFSKDIKNYTEYKFLFWK